MKVLHILEATGGGTRRHILDLLPALQARGVACTLLASPLRDPYFMADARTLQAQGVRVCAVPMTRGFDPRHDARALRQIIAHLRRERPDIVHCHSTKAGFLGRMALPATWRGRTSSTRCPRTRLVYTPHCIAFDTHLPQFQRRAARLIETLLAPLTSHFIAVSQHEKEALRRAGLAPNKRISTIHNGVNLHEFDALPLLGRAVFGLCEDDFVIGCFGRLTRQKNQAAVLHALHRVLDCVPQARLLLVGGGEDEAPLRALAHHLRIGERIVRTGEVGEARPFYALCDLVVQPSRWEGCPYSILEAMTARRAIIATPVGGVPELLRGDGDGVTVGVLDSSSGARNLAALIAELAASETCRAHLGNAARQRVEDQFRVEQMVEKTLAVYHSVAE